MKKIILIIVMVIITAIISNLITINTLKIQTVEDTKNGQLVVVESMQQVYEYYIEK